MFEHSLGGSRIQNPLPTLAPPAPPVQPAAGRVSEHVDVGRSDRGQNPLGHYFAGLLQVGVHGGNHNIERSEDLVGQVERAVGQDVDLGAAEYSKVGEAAVHLVDLRLARQKAFGRES